MDARKRRSSVVSHQTLQERHLVRFFCIVVPVLVAAQFASSEGRKGLYHLEYRLTQENEGEIPVHPPLIVGAFNIQTLGKAKFKNLEVMKTIYKIIVRYDLILIQEIIVTNSDKEMYDLLEKVNKIAPEGVVYKMSLSERVGGNNTEQYAYIYRSDKFQVLTRQHYFDVDDDFYRTPYVVLFGSPTLRDLTRFLAIGLHAKPKDAMKEISALAKAYDHLRLIYKIDDVLILGDLNADCDSVKEIQWEKIDLWTREEFIWPLKHDIDTTTNHRSCALDRFVLAGKNMEKAAIMSSAQIFNFKETFGLTTKETRAVSDHWPIEIKLRGKMSSIAESHLTTDICFTMGDTRRVSTPDDVIAKGIAAGFTATKDYSDILTLYHSSSSEESMKNSLKRLSKELPEVISHEQLHGTLYKIEHGSLNDDSSNQDIEQPTYLIKVIVDQTNSMSEIMVCRKSSVN